MLKTKLSYTFLFVAAFTFAATAMLFTNSSTASAIECDVSGVQTPAPGADCPVVEFGASISGNYRSAIAGIGLYEKETTDSFTMEIPSCTAGAPTIIRASAMWSARDYDDPSHWDDTVSIARDANPAVSVTQDRRWKADMNGGANTSYVSDITADGIVAVGTNTYTITNFEISPGAVNTFSSQWGFGIHAIYECPEYDPVIIQQFEGHDVHWRGWGLSGGATTVPTFDDDRSELICEEFPASVVSRNVALHTFVPGSADAVNRQADIWYKSDTGSAPGRADYDLLTDVISPANDGIVMDRLVISGEPELDTYTNTVTIPAGHEYICFQVDSSFGTGEHPDSVTANGASMFTGLQWVTYDETVLAATTVSLGDMIWEDTNNNGVIDGSEAGICGVTVNLYEDTNSDGKYTVAAEGTTPDATTTTACAGTVGAYSFNGLTPGDYIVVIPQDQFESAAALDGYVSSTGTNGSATGSYEPSPDPDNDINDDDNGYHIDGVGVATCAVTLTVDGEPTNDGDTDNDTNLSVDFGFFQQAKLGNFVWNDVNSNGVQDTGELGIANATATLYSSTDDSVIATATTDSDGMYNFCYLIAGTYYVIFSDLPDEAVITQVNSGDDDEGDSDVGAATLRTPDYTLTAGQVETSVDAGVILSLASTGLDTTSKIYTGIVLAVGAVFVTKAKGGSIYRTRRSLSF